MHGDRKCYRECMSFCPDRSKEVAYNYPGVFGGVKFLKAIEIETAPVATVKFFECVGVIHTQVVNQRLIFNHDPAHRGRNLVVNNSEYWNCFFAGNLRF